MTANKKMAQVKNEMTAVMERISERMTDELPVDWGTVGDYERALYLLKEAEKKVSYK
jgi:hypothetical protein